MESIYLSYCIIAVLLVFLLWFIKAFLPTLIKAKMANLDLEVQDYLFIYKNNINISDFINARNRLKKIFTTISFQEFASHVTAGGNINTVVRILEKAHEVGKVISVKEALNIELMKSIANKYGS